MTIQFEISPALAETPEKQTVTHPRVPVLPPSMPPVTLNGLLPEDVRSHNLVLALPYYYPRSRDTPDPSPPSRATKYFTPLDGSQPIDKALSGTAYVEYPTIRVFDRTEWLGKLSSGEVMVVSKFETKASDSMATSKAVPAKRERPEELGLGLGAYDSNSEEEDGAGHGDSGDDEGGGGQNDVVLSPRLAQALGQALEADFGPTLVSDA